jgi:hypothetical protein
MQGRNSFLIACLIFFTPLAALTQDITGLWKGLLHNDTTGLNLRYEIAISEYKGKLSGYSHTFFILDDKEYYGVKKVKIRKEDNKIIVQDYELISNNYPEPPAKNVHQLDVLILEMQDSTMILSGPFSTNRTKQYHSLTGSIRVQRKNDFWNSALVPHLEELGLTRELSFIPITPDLGSRSVVTTAPITTSEPRSNNGKLAVKDIKPVKGKMDTTKVAPTTVAKTNPVVTIAEPIAVKPSGPAADVEKRKIETVQSVYYKSDSLLLTLYDNGEVDGDTVSVLMNGKVIMPMVGLSTRAVRKTIYITKDTPDSIQLIMYAENLGSIPPNTGLLVVHDGEDIYEIRFSGDYSKNAAIVFRRKGR